MKPGERIRIITECAESLRARAWPEAQLILDQFGFDTYEPGRDWHEPDEQSYFVGQLKEGANESLVQLHEYLVGGDAAPFDPGDQPWGALPLKVFLSHIHLHRGDVAGVKLSLAQCAVDSFVAHDDIQPSKQWREVIKAALRSCDALVAFLHNGFHASQWCDQEVGWAIGRSVPIVVVRPPDSERLDGFLEEHQDMPLSNEAAIASAILKVLLNDPRTNAAAIRSLVEALVLSRSFDRTRRLCGLLEQQPKIEPEQLRRLEYAVQTNRQVYDAVYPARAPNAPIADFIRNLAARHAPRPAIQPAPHEEEPF